MKKKLFKSYQSYLMDTKMTLLFVLYSLETFLQNRMDNMEKTGISTLVNHKYMKSNYKNTLTILRNSYYNFHSFIKGHNSFLFQECMMGQFRMFFLIQRFLISFQRNSKLKYQTVNLLRILQEYRIALKNSFYLDLMR